MNKKILAGIAAVAVTAAAFAAWRMWSGQQVQELSLRELEVTTGAISETVLTTGVVEPRNRLKIQSSIAGRVEEIMVDEGALVAEGDRLAMLSSTERAALLDAARLNDQSEQEYWEEVYKKTVILSPIDAQVIVRSIEPGQTVTTSDSLFVLSDRLIVTAYVDETDIGRVAEGQAASISLDAYPDITVTGRIDHIHYESHLENNVNIYDVDIIPDTIPEVYRSGMSATVDIVVEEKNDALLLPPEALQSIDGKTVVMQRSRGHDTASPSWEYVEVTSGLQNEHAVEIVDGLEAGDHVFVENGGFVLSEKNGGTNPFMPSRKR